MKWYSILLIVILVIMLIMTLVHDHQTKKKKDAVLTQLSQALLKRDFKSYYQIIEDHHQLFSSYNQIMMILQADIMQDHLKEVKKKTKQLSHEKLTKKQKQMLYNILFNYFMTKEEYRYAKACLNKLYETKNVELVHDCEIMYDTFALKGYEYLDEVIDLLPALEDSKRYHSEYLLSEMYKNKGDMVKSKEYQDLYLQHMNQQ